MNKQRLGIGIFLALAAGFLIIGCNLPGVDPRPLDTVEQTPFADEPTLNELSEQRDVVNWKVARFFALNELANSRKELSWDGTELSEYPLIIYNAQNGEPRYYEFRVLDGANEIGAITCSAQKKEGSPVQFVLPFTRKISDQNARSIKSRSLFLADTGYPGRLIAKDTFGGRNIDAVSGQEDTGEYPVDLNVVDFLKEADGEALASLGISDEETRNAFISEAEKEQAELAAFWEAVDGITEKIVDMSEAELREAFGQEASERVSTYTNYSGNFTLDAWYNKSGWPVFGTYCGPDVVAFIMLGLGTASGYSNIPTSNNQTLLYNYYRAVENKMGTGWKYYYLLSDGNKGSMDDGLKSLTGNRYGFSAQWSIPGIVGHSWNSVDRGMRATRLPAVSLRTGKVFEGNWPWHYRTIIGTRAATSYLKMKVLWWTVNVPYWSEGQYSMHDNGSERGNKIHNWWEGWSIYQFQAAQVVKR